MRFADSDSSDETATSTSDATESSAGGHTDKEINDADLKEDRFRVDRRKLERMLQGETLVSNGQTAEDFFHKIMEETNTQISWPSKLKVGAKSKKDPHIKITGDPENVYLAREKVLEILDTKRNKVTLKMDVSFTDHSHIIGKGGHSIQQVMEDTGCHIHFPDSNRSSVGEKSNQVSVAGMPDGVEKARCKIRELLPMVLTFDIPQTTGFLQPVPDVSSPAIQLIQQRHGFTVSFRPKQRATTVVVRGSRRLFLQQRQGVHMLMDYLTGGSGTVLPVSLSMEVTPQHHAFVMGRGNSNIATITRETGATVTFPDPALFPNYSASNPFHVSTQTQTTLRRSTVVISGHIDGVCAAWQELMGCLPLVLMFDLKEGQELDTVQVTRLMDQLDVNIVIRPKPKQNTKCLLVRGAEKDSRLLFEVRRQLLGVDLTEEALPVCCENHSDGYEKQLSIPNLISCSKPTPVVSQHVDQDTQQSNDMNSNHINGNYTNGLPSYQQLNSQLLQPPPPPPVSMQFNNNSDLSGMLGGQGSYPLLPWILNQLSGCQNPLYSALLQARMSDLALASLLNRSIKDFGIGPPFSDQASNSSQASSLSSPNESPCESPVFMTNVQGGSSLSSCGSMDSLSGERDSFSSTKSWNNPFCNNNGNSCASTTSDLYSDFSDHSSLSSTSSEHLQALSRVPQPTIQGHSTALNPVQPNTAFQSRKMQNQGRPILAAPASCLSKEEVSSLAAGQNSIGMASNVGCERRSDVTSALADYNAKKLQAVQAVQKPVASGARVPTDVWSGYGFSKTMPEDLLRNRLQESRVLSQRRLDSVQQTSTGTWQDGWYGQTSSVQEHFPERKTGFATSVDTAIPFSSSNYFDNNLLPKDLVKDIKDLTHLLSLLGLEKYLDVFQQQQVDLPTFLTLTDKDLQELSIPFFGRRKMLKAMSELKVHNENYLSRQPLFQQAPGAERRALFSRQQSAFGQSTGSDW